MTNYCKNTCILSLTNCATPHTLMMTPKSESLGPQRAILEVQEVWWSLSEESVAAPVQLRRTFRILFQRLLKCKETQLNLLHKLEVLLLLATVAFILKLFNFLDPPPPLSCLELRAAVAAPAIEQQLSALSGRHVIDTGKAARTRRKRSVRGGELF